MLKTAPLRGPWKEIHTATGDPNGSFPKPKTLNPFRVPIIRTVKYFGVYIGVPPFWETTILESLIIKVLIREP